MIQFVSARYWFQNLKLIEFQIIDKFCYHCQSLCTTNVDWMKFLKMGWEVSLSVCVCAFNVYSSIDWNIIVGIGLCIHYLILKCKYPVLIQHLKRESLLTAISCLYRQTIHQSFHSNCCRIYVKIIICFLVVLVLPLFKLQFASSTINQK